MNNCSWCVWCQMRRSKPFRVALLVLVILAAAYLAAMGEGA